MKKIFLFFLIIIPVLSGNLQAQLEKGRIMTGLASTLNKEIYNSDLANAGFSTSRYKSPTGEENEPNKITGFNLIPSAGYFIINNLAAGLNLYFSYNKDKSGESDFARTDFQVCAVPFIRYYYPLGKIYPFAELSAGLGKRTSKTESTNSDNKTSWGVNILGGGAGVALPLGDRVTFDVIAGYSRVSLKGEPQENVTTRDIYGSFGVKMGFMVYFEL